MDDIYSIYQDLRIRIQETVSNASESAMVICFSYWFILSIIYLWIILTLPQNPTLGVLATIVGIILCIGYIIILIPGLLGIVLGYISLWVLAERHFRIAKRLEDEFYEIDGPMNISDILRSSRRLYQNLKGESILYYPVLWLIFFLEKKGNNHTYEVSEVSIDARKAQIKTLKEALQIKESELALSILDVLRGKLETELAGYQQALENQKDTLLENKNIPELRAYAERHIEKIDILQQKFENLRYTLL